jgi:hypothetical protein
MVTSINKTHMKVLIAKSAAFLAMISLAVLIVLNLGCHPVGSPLNGGNTTSTAGTVNITYACEAVSGDTQSATRQFVYTFATPTPLPGTASHNSTFSGSQASQQIFYSGSTIPGTTTPSVFFAWSVPGLGFGTWTITLTATDEHGISAKSTATVTVSASAPQQEVHFDNVNPGATVGNASLATYP